jgi:hypothetical protein
MGTMHPTIIEYLANDRIARLIGEAAPSHQRSVDRFRETVTSSVTPSTMPSLAGSRGQPQPPLRVESQANAPSQLLVLGHHRRELQQVGARK